MIALRAKRHLFAFSVALSGFDLGDLCEKPSPRRPQTSTGPFTRLPSGSNSEICSISVYEANRIVLANRFFVAVLQKVLGLLRRRKLCYHVVVR